MTDKNWLQKLTDHYNTETGQSLTPEELIDREPADLFKPIKPKADRSEAAKKAAATQAENRRESEKQTKEFILSEIHLGTSIEDIADMMNEKGWKTHQGKEWTADRVKATRDRD